MEKYVLKDEFSVFGFKVKSFPQGIREAFDTLVTVVPEGLNRSYYGLSYMNSEGEIVYIAAVEEKKAGEGSRHNFENFTIGKGIYLYVPIKDWMKNVDRIKDVFHEMMKDANADLTQPCIEWYKSDDEMWCMLKTKVE